MHSINIALHVAAGLVALALGFVILFKKKGTALHRQLGRLFCYMSMVVCTTAVFGLAAFNFRPLFAALTILVAYQVVSGWRVVRTRQFGPSRFDGAWTLAAITAAVTLTVALSRSDDPNRVGAYATLGAVALVVCYDACRWIFPKRWHAIHWRYEHTYKMVSSLFGMLSAFVGSVLLVDYPSLPLAVTAVGQFVIVWLFYLMPKASRS